MQALTTTVARILFAIPFGIFGLFHFMNAGAMAGMVPIPGGVLWIYVTGIGLLLACVSIIIKKQDRLASLLLALMLVLFIFTMHLPNAMGGDQMAMINLLKDLGLTGGALTYAGLAK